MADDQFLGAVVVVCVGMACREEVVLMVDALVVDVVLLNPGPVSQTYIC